jgi:hypothetical protein
VPNCINLALRTQRLKGFLALTQPEESTKELGSFKRPVTSFLLSTSKQMVSPDPPTNLFLYLKSKGRHKVRVPLHQQKGSRE